MPALYDPTDLEGQSDKHRERDERTKLAALQEIEDMKWLMGSKRGRRIVWRLIGQAGVFRPTFNPNAMQMAFAEGNRNAGNRTLSMVMASSPELFATMLKEQASDEPNADDGSAQSKRR